MDRLLANLTASNNFSTESPIFCMTELSQVFITTIKKYPDMATEIKNNDGEFCSLNFFIYNLVWIKDIVYNNVKISNMEDFGLEIFNDDFIFIDSKDIVSIDMYNINLSLTSFTEDSIHFIGYGEYSHELFETESISTSEILNRYKTEPEYPTLRT